MERILIVYLKLQRRSKYTGVGRFKTVQMLSYTTDPEEGAGMELALQQ